MRPFNFNTTKSIISEVGAIQRISEICLSLHIKRPVIITDAGIVRCGLLTSLEHPLSNSALAYVVFDQVAPDPGEETIHHAVALAKQHQCDGVIGFGGGSSMDTAKLVAVLCQSTQALSTMYGLHNVTGSRLPLILIPTTAGTGSEVTPISIVTTGETSKAGVVANQLLPDVALLDANLTLGLPAHVTAATGIDAMVHAIEAYTSAEKKNMYSDMLAIAALKLLSKNIKTATFEPDNIEARQAMLLGSCLAGQAFANAPVAAVHALAYPLGGHFHIPHGLSNALVLPHVMRFNASHCSALYAQIAQQIMPEVIDGEVSNEQATECLIDTIENLIKSLQLPCSLAQMEINESQLEMLAADAMLQTRLLINNPKPVSLEDAREIYQHAHKGI